MPRSFDGLCQTFLGSNTHGPYNVGPLKDAIRRMSTSKINGPFLVQFRAGRASAEKDHGLAGWNEN